MKKDLLNNPNIEAEDDGGEILFNLNELSDSNFKRLVEYYDAISEAPLEYLITATLSAFAGLIGKRAYLEITDYLIIYPNIYAMIIGKSSVMKKTTALNLATRELQRLDDKRRYEYTKELKEYETALKQKKKEEENNFMDLVKPTRDYLILPNDSTVEALTEILSFSERGLLVHNEIGGWLAAMNKGYAGDSKMFFTALYDVPATYEVSRVVKGTTYLHRPILSILGASTIDWVIENSTKSDITSGFFARFAYAIRNVPIKTHIPLLKLGELKRTIDNVPDVKALHENLLNLTKTKMDITKEAVEYHANYDIETYNELLTLENQDEISFKIRLLVYSVKFAIILALADGRNVIKLKDIKDAIALTEYYKKNVSLLLTQELTKTEFTREEERIYNMIAKRGDSGMKRTDLLRNVRLKAKELNEIINNLFEKELITKEEIRNGSKIKKSIIYKVS